MALFEIFFFNTHLIFFWMKNADPATLAPPPKSQISAKFSQLQEKKIVSGIAGTLSIHPKFNKNGDFVF